MKTPLVEYPNAHATNPYYAPVRVGFFADEMHNAYVRLNARLAERHEAELVSLCPELPAIPSRGPEFPYIRLPDGGVQYILPDVG
jgi:hypothetical protein